MREQQYDLRGNLGIEIAIIKREQPGLGLLGPIPDSASMELIPTVNGVWGYFIEKATESTTTHLFYSRAGTRQLWHAFGDLGKPLNYEVYTEDEGFDWEKENILQTARGLIDSAGIELQGGFKTRMVHQNVEPFDLTLETELRSLTHEEIMNTFPPVITDLITFAYERVFSEDEC